MPLLNLLNPFKRQPAIKPRIAKISYTMPCDYHGWTHVLDVYVPYWPEVHGGMSLVQDYLDDLAQDDSVESILTEYDAVVPEGTALFV